MTRRGPPSDTTTERQRRAWALRTAVVSAAHRVADAAATGNPKLEREAVNELVVAVLAYRGRGKTA